MERNVGDDILAIRDTIAFSSLPEQEVALVPREFAAEFENELMLEWKLFDPLGKLHLVSYDKNLETPNLFKGLMEIRKYYSLKGLNWFLLRHHDLSNFSLFIYNESIEEVCYLSIPPPPVIMPLPAVNSNTVIGSNNLPVTPEPTIQANWIFYPCFFTCKLSSNQATGSQLNVAVHVYEYLRDGQLYNWILRGPSGTEVDCTILGVPQRKYAKFGRGWKAFCNTHELKAGDVLSFFLTSEVIGFIDVLFQ